MEDSKRKIQFFFGLTNLNIFYFGKISFSDISFEVKQCLFHQSLYKFFISEHKRVVSSADSADIEPARGGGHADAAGGTAGAGVAGGGRAGRGGAGVAAAAAARHVDAARPRLRPDIYHSY